jgi:hypothetical protein
MKCEGNKFQIRVLTFTVIASYFISVEIIKALQVSQGQCMWMEMIKTITDTDRKSILVGIELATCQKNEEGPG